MVVSKVFSTCKTIFKVEIKSQILPELIKLWCIYYNIWTSFYLLLCTWRVRISRPEEFCKKGVLKNSTNSQENICSGVSFAIKLQAGGLQLYQIQNLVQVLSCKFWVIFIRISILQTSVRACLWRVRSFLESLSVKF